MVTAVSKTEPVRLGDFIKFKALHPFTLNEVTVVYKVWVQLLQHGSLSV